MCGRFTFQPTEELYERFRIVNRLDSLVARYNIAPAQMVPVAISQSPNQVVLMRWGLIPHWAKDEKTAYKMINPRVETLAQKPAFRGLLAANRLLVPASGFYEWKEEARGKTPYYIHPRGGQFFAFAGLYDVWTKPDGEELYTFTIITKDADEVMARLHNRMPVILERDLEDDWLDTELTSVSVDWVRQMMQQVRRWLPGRRLVLVVDGGLAAVSLALACVKHRVVTVSRLRWNAAWSHRPGPQPAGKCGPQPTKWTRQRSLRGWASRSDTPWEDVEVDWYGGQRKQLWVFCRTALWHTPGWPPVDIRYVLVADPEGKLRIEAFFCTDLQATPVEILPWVVMRWSIEVTCEG